MAPFMDRKHKGACSELKACAHLLEMGYEVYRNVSQHGSIDLISRDPKTGDIQFFDVKTIDNKYGLTNRKIPEHVRPITVNSDTGEITLH